MYEYEPAICVDLDSGRNFYIYMFNCVFKILSAHKLTCFM